MPHSRTNQATKANVYKNLGIFASGAFKNVWRGTYIDGARAGQACVAKEFKTGSVYEAHYFQEELNIVSRAQTIIDAFHRAGVVDMDIRLNTPEIWENKTGAKALIEPMIENFEKFNSNSGWAPRTGNVWSEAMQALSHFSYHDSDGEFLLCDLQGGAYRDGYVLSDPVIMSSSGDCGPADLGPDGISAFFQRHECGSFCRRSWTCPDITGRVVVPLREGTTMRRLPARQTRDPLSRFRE